MFRCRVNEVYVGTIEKIRQLALGNAKGREIKELQVLEWEPRCGY